MNKYRYDMLRFLSQFRSQSDYSVRIENVKWSEDLNKAVEYGFVKFTEKPKGQDYYLKIRCTLRGRLYFRRHKQKQSNDRISMSF